MSNTYNLVKLHLLHAESHSFTSILGKICRYFCCTGIPRLVLLLLSSGIVSVFERLVLASTQQRLSPVNATLFGVSNLVFDGLKLFSKVSFEFLSASSMLLVCSLCSSAFVMDFIFGRSVINQSFQLYGLLFFVVELFELGIFVFSTVSRNHFVSLALSRLAIIGTITALTLELIVL